MCQGSKITSSNSTANSDLITDAVCVTAHITTTDAGALRDR